MPPKNPAPTVPVRFAGASSFRQELVRRVDEYFEARGIGRDGGWRILFKSALIGLWFAVSWALLVFWADAWWQMIPLTISLGLAMAGIGFNVQHDGGHRAFSRNRVINRMALWALDLIGGSSYFWHYKHNLAHHTYTNVAGVDEDIDAAPFLRLAPAQRRRWYHRFQHVYVWGLLVFFLPKWEVVDDFQNLIMGRVGGRKIPRPKGLDLLVFVAGKLAFLTWVLVLPLIFHSWPVVLAGYLLLAATVGITIATVFQLAHCVEGAEFFEPPGGDGKVERGWAEHQLATTVNFADRNRWLTWYLGGLNHQIEHHLFPRISHVHYPAIAPIVRAVCAEHGIEHRTKPTMRAAVASHVRFLRDLGRAA